ncbi:hypothetical protein BURPSS13_J0256 [Burkholderia pseudomallei S13]|nr:hypothetical protein BURPSS13_J0256 [Burkholderia pseudomallei S13]
MLHRKYSVDAKSDAEFVRFFHDDAMPRAHTGGRRRDSRDACSGGRFA